MAEAKRNFGSSRRKDQNIIRLFEEQRKPNFLKLNFPGLTGMILPTIERLQQKVVPALDQKLRSALIQYLRGVLVALPEENMDPSLRLPEFDAMKWRKIPSIRRECLEIGIVIPRSPKEIREYWFRKDVKFTRVPGVKERRFTTKTLGEKIKRKLEADEKIQLGEAKSILNSFIQYLESSQSFEEQKKTELQNRVEEIRRQIGALIREKEETRHRLIESQKTLYEQQEKAPQGSALRRKVDEALQKNRTKILEKIERISSEIEHKSQELEHLEKNNRKKIKLEARLNRVWESMRLRGELKDE